MRTTFVQADRCVGAFAGYADDAADWSAAWRRDAGRRLSASLRRWLRAASGLCGLLLRLRDRHEVVVRDWILVLLSQKLLLYKDVETRRVGVRRTALKHADGMRDLLAAEDKFLFLFARRLLFPHWHSGGHDHGHDGNGDNQSGHGVPAFVHNSRLLALTR